MDCLSQGTATPLGALPIRFMVAREIKSKTLLEELHTSGTKRIGGSFTFRILLRQT